MTTSVGQAIGSWVQSVVPAVVGALDHAFPHVPAAPATTVSTMGAGSGAPAAGSGAAAAPTTSPAAGAKQPVLLVHGFGSSGAAFGSYAAALRRDGYDVTVVELPNHAQGDIDASARVLGQAVDAVKARTGSATVDLVGHSEGGLVARDYVERQGGAASVHAVVTVGTPHEGLGLGAAVNQAVLGIPGVRDLLPVAAQQMIQGSDFLRTIDGADGRLDPRVQYRSIFNAADDGVVAAANSSLPGAHDVALEPTLGRSHAGLLQDDGTYAAVVAGL